MAEHATIQGVWTALITPFTQNYDIDWPSFGKIIRQQAEAGVNGVVISGTTGESPTLETEEKIKLIKFAREHLPSHIRIMAGTGCNHTHKSVHLSKQAADAGADSLLVVTPPYNKPSLKGLQKHFEMISNATTLPICLYHVPGRTGQTLTAQEVSTLAQIPNIVAVKEASGNMALYSRMLIASSKTNPDISFLSGDDPTFLASLAVGGKGVISVIANVFPKAVTNIWQAFENGEGATSLTIHNTLLKIIDDMFIESNPGPVKYAMHLADLCEDILRPPLTSIEDRSKDIVRKSFEETSQKLKNLGHNL